MGYYYKKHDDECHKHFEFECKCRKKYYDKYEDDYKKKCHDKYEDKYEKKYEDKYEDDYYFKCRCHKVKYYKKQEKY